MISNAISVRKTFKERKVLIVHTEADSRQHTFERLNGQNLGFPRRPYFRRYIPFLRVVMACEKKAKVRHILIFEENGRPKDIDPFAAPNYLLKRKSNEKRKKKHKFEERSNNLES